MVKGDLNELKLTEEFAEQTSREIAKEDKRDLARNRGFNEPETTARYQWRIRFVVGRDCHWNIG